ncbi:MAG TPA: glycoside hydrolase family 88 protein [Bacteroidales bacterium]|nr:glycoside hydrolase family 88 protein [Bacteroidales bacterium]
MGRLRKIIQGIVMFVIAGGACITLNAQKMSSSKILEEMNLANSYFVNSQKLNSGGVTDFIRGNTWRRSFYYEGLSAYYSVSHDSASLASMLNWGNAYSWGMPGGVSTREPRDQCCGQTYTDMYLLDRYKEERIDDTRVCIETMLSSGGNDYWKTTDDLQMAMPLFAGLGKVYDDDRYFDRMNEMYEYTKSQLGGSGLYSEDDHLWYRDTTFLPPYKEPNGGKCFWSRGNGWVIAALVRSADRMPNNSYRRSFLKTLKEMIETIVPLQRPDGFWNVSLKDPDHFGGKETTGTALFVYGLAWAINNGEIKGKEYLPVVEKAWNALVDEALHADGSIGYVQGDGSGPGDGQPVTEKAGNDFSDVALGCFLLAGSEVYKIAKSSEPREKKPKEPKNNKKHGQMNLQRGPGGRGHRGSGGGYPGHLPGR